MAPDICKKHSEIPNHLRSALGLSSRKYEGSKFSREDGTHTIPDALALAVESLTLDMLSSGQEVSLGCVKKVMLEMITLWNEQINEFRQDILKTMGEQIVAQNAKNDGADTPLQKALKVLQPCNASKHPSAIMNLGLYWLAEFDVLLHIQVCWYIYIYIYINV